MTTLHPPFFIGSNLCPALKVGGCTLSLTNIEVTPESRDRATFELYWGPTSYVDDQLQSGVGGFRSQVEAFESFLCFLEAAGESYKYGREEGENASDLFPVHVVIWASENMDEISMVRCGICDEDGYALHHLIEG